MIYVVGTRPNIVKVASLLRKGDCLIHTGQHYDYEMSRCFFEQLAVPEPDINLGLHTRDVKTIEEELKKVLNDTTVVIGDVNSSLAAARAAKYLGLSVIHIEAGLRCGEDIIEERNRIEIDNLSDLLLVPEYSGMVNLSGRENVFAVGNIAIDTLENNREKMEKSNILERLELKEKQYVLVTLHRDGIEQNANVVANELRKISKFTGVIFPAHPKIKIDFPTIQPLNYLDFIKTLSCSKVVITDSGGVQAEAFHLGIPCVTARNSTEWKVTLGNKYNVLVGLKLLKGYNRQCKRTLRPSDYWDGKAAERIQRIIDEFEFQSKRSNRNDSPVSVCS